MTNDSHDAKIEADSGETNTPSNGSAAKPTPKKKAAKKAAKKATKSKTTAKTTIKKKATAKKATTKKAATKKAPAKKAATKKKKPSGKSLVIVESPAKARTINKYLGNDYVVRASMGHIRDLPKGKFGIDIEHDFEPEYQAIRGKSKVITELKKLAKTAPTVYLAPDLDREGEAIAWHLAESLDVDDDRVFRVVFNEITKPAILEAFSDPGKLNMSKVDAQQARRVLDRIMGYKLSPLLWKKIAKGLSAGRVQSVATRLIVERELEIRKFVKEEYWRVTAHMKVDGQAFDAELRRLAGRRIEKNLSEEDAKGLVASIGNDPLLLAELENKPKTRRPTPPFATSQLQQKASTMLRFSARKTMMIAQQLYEGVDIPGEGSVGLITYMRTDSVRVSDTALGAARELIQEQYGKEYVPDKPNVFANRSKAAQEAHEAVRPTEVRRIPAEIKKALTDDQFKLYKLIWEKFVSSQMKPATFNITTAVFEHSEGRFVAQGEMETFDGHLRVLNASARPSDKGPQSLPKSLTQGESYQPAAKSTEPVAEGDKPKPHGVQPTQHFTQPPPRYTEATLVKELEKKGIGRPSTYATIISTIQDRGYVVLESRHFLATELGEIVTLQLMEHFGDVIDSEFTSRMENNLDLVEDGSLEWRTVVKNFHEIFATNLEKAEVSMKNLKTNPELTERKCEKCNSPMAVLYNKRGKFLGCSNYPECKNTMPVDGPREKAEVIETDYTCPKCEKPMVIRTGKRGRFLACTGFPKCKSTASVDDEGKKIEPKKTGIMCEKCNAEMVIKGSRRGPFLACSGYPKCRNAKPLPEELREPPRETGEKCEKCGSAMVAKTSRWGKEFIACSAYPECRNTKDPSKMGKPEDGESADDDGAPQPAAGSEASDS